MEFQDLNFIIPAKTGRAVEDVVLQIEAAIINKKIFPGDRLPSEREMHVRFQTGRGVIREALQVLKQKGLIEIKKGAKGGAYVKNLEAIKVSESMSLFLKQNDIPPESIVEFRESIDSTITTLAIARGSADEKNSLVEKTLVLYKLLHNMEPDMSTIIELDRELNLMLVKMTRNPVFEWIMHALQSGFSSYDFALYEDENFRKETADNWIATAREIAACEPIRAHSYISRHYIFLRECINEKLR
jgi:DNA-binding FadR family transcriptional regulator